MGGKVDSRGDTTIVNRFCIPQINGCIEAAVDSLIGMYQIDGASSGSTMAPTAYAALHFSNALIISCFIRVMVPEPP